MRLDDCAPLTAGVGVLCVVLGLVLGTVIPLIFWRVCKYTRSKRHNVADSQTPHGQTDILDSSTGTSCESE